MNAKEFLDFVNRLDKPSQFVTATAIVNLLQKGEMKFGPGIKETLKLGKINFDMKLKLKFLGLFKCALNDRLNPEVDLKPDAFDLIESSKWDAWMKAGGNKEQAQEDYVIEGKKILDDQNYTKAIDTNCAKITVENFTKAVNLYLQELNKLQTKRKSNLQDKIIDVAKDLIKALKAHKPKEMDESKAWDDKIKNIENLIKTKQIEEAIKIIEVSLETAVKIKDTSIKTGKIGEGLKKIVHIRKAINDIAKLPTTLVFTPSASNDPSLETKAQAERVLSDPRPAPALLYSATAPGADPKSLTYAPSPAPDSSPSQGPIVNKSPFGTPPSSLNLDSSPRSTVVGGTAIAYALDKQSLEKGIVAGSGSDSNPNSGRKP